MTQDEQNEDEQIEQEAERVKEKKKKKKKQKTQETSVWVEDNAEEPSTSTVVEVGHSEQPSPACCSPESFAVSAVHREC